ncbi:MAG: response regulator [Symploca sp. SIO2B6]|nr:response regulator [Symploca sp. SIO2B6]
MPVWSYLSDEEGAELSPTPSGIFLGSLKIDRIHEVVNQLNYGENSYPFALNSEGQAIVHPDASLMSTKEKPAPSFLDLPDVDLVAIAQNMVNKGQGIELQSIDGKLQYVAFLPLEEADWSVALIIPRKNIEGQLLPLDLMAGVVAALTVTLMVMLWRVQAFEQRQITKTKEAAEAANHAKSEFLANMSHELRTPLNGILGFAQILQLDTTATPKQKHGLSIIEQSGKHLLTLINDVLDISKIEARKLDLFPSPVHLPSFLQGIVEIIRIRADQKGLKLLYQPTANLPEGTEVDEQRLRQVLINLLGNAVKFTDTGSITFKISTLLPTEADNVLKDTTSPAKTSNHSEPVTDPSEPPPNHPERCLNSPDETPSQSQCILRFDIIDTGVGMAPELVDTIFNPFEQVGEAKRKTEGTGLGLAISQRIVNLMGSQIEVQSTLGEGSRFSFTVEVPVAMEWRQTIQSSNGNSIIGYTGERKTILIVDDRWENRSVLVNLLEPLGFTLVEAANGKEGLAKAIEHLPDLIITDLAMPEMDGYEFITAVRQDKTLKDIKMLVSSASVSSGDRQTSIDAGANDFLPKPVSSEELFQQLEKILQLNWEQMDEDGHTNHEPISRSSLYPSRSKNGASVSANWVTPPMTDMETLYKAAQIGDIRTVEKEAINVQALDERYRPFAQHLLYLANQMDERTILNLMISLNKSVHTN